MSTDDTLPNPSTLGHADVTPDNHSVKDRVSPRLGGRGATSSGLPLSTLLSHVLIALTIEFDNEFERRMPHRTTNYGASAIGDGPWLVSQVMWTNFMRFIGEDGIPIRELQRLAFATKERMYVSLAGMTRWGYVVVEPDSADRCPRPPRPNWIVRTTPAGRKAQEVWRPLLGEIEQRWRARCDNDEIGKLRRSLSALVSQLDSELPEYLPLLRYGLFTDLPPQRDHRSVERNTSAASDLSLADLSLSVLLSQALLTLTIDFERDSALSLAICANALRILDIEGVPVRDLPRLSCVAKEAISNSIGFLERGGYVVVEPDPAVSRSKVARLTPKGQKAQDAYRRRLGVVANLWQERFGTDTISNLQESLKALVHAPDAGLSPLLSRALEPPPHSWRALIRKLDGLPHHPLVLHRGGFPDGS